MSSTTPTNPDKTDLKRALLDPGVRKDFPIFLEEIAAGQPLVFLDNAASTQRPAAVIDAISHVYRHDYANVHRGIHTLSERSTELYEQAREKVRDFIGAERAREVLFTQGTTGSINCVARSWGDANLRAGDEILLTAMEHHSNLVPWQQAAARTGARLRHIRLTDDGRLDLESLDELLSERTRLVAFTAVSNVLGTINPVADIVRRAHEAGAVALVDAAQSVPHMPIDVRGWDADFVAFSGHKMLGPSGVGVLYGKETLLEAMPPFLGGGSMINEVRLDGFTPAELPAKFEAGTPPIVPAIGMSAAIDYLSRIGIASIGAHEHSLTQYAYEQMKTIDGLRILGPAPEHRVGLISFAFERVHAHEFAQVLNDRFGIAVRAGHHCAQPLHTQLGITASTRASFYLYNTLEEIDQLIEGIRTVRALFAPRGRRRRPRRRQS